MVEVEVHGVSDLGAFSEEILELRKRKEKTATRHMLQSRAQGGPLGLKNLTEAQRWLFLDHKAYAASTTTRGEVAAKMAPEDRKLMETY